MVQNLRLDWQNFVKNLETPTNLIGVDKFERLGEIDSDKLERKIAKLYSRPEEQYAMISFDSDDECPFLTADVYSPKAEADMITDMSKSNSNKVPGLSEERLSDISKIHSILRREYDNINVEKGAVLSPEYIETLSDGEESGQAIRSYLEEVNDNLATNSNVKWVMEDEDERVEWVYDRDNILDAINTFEKDSGRTDRPALKKEMASRTPFRNTSEYANMKNRSLELAKMNLDNERAQEIYSETMEMFADSDRFRVENIEPSINSSHGNKI